MNKPPYGNAIRLLDVTCQFKVVAQDQPNKTVKISAGSFISGPGNIVEFNGGNTPIINSPTLGSTWNLISLSPTGSITVTSGTTPPQIQKNFLGLALIFLKNTDQSITNDMIFDIRPVFANQHYATSHNELTNILTPDCHPVSAITGLTDLLADKVGQNEFENGILNKADVDGTMSQTFTLNTDQTGEPAENVELIVSRGSSPSVSIRWDETDDKWKFTNDGNQWFDFLTEFNETDLSVYALSTDVSSTYLTKADAATTYALSTALDNYVAKADASVYALSTDVSSTYLTKADAATTYALSTALDNYVAKQVGISGTFTTVDNKTITILDGIVTGIQ
jgi:hypothetical protein